MQQQHQRQLQHGTIMKLSTVRWRLGTQSYFGNLRDPRLYATSLRGASCVLAKEFQETVSVEYDLSKPVNVKCLR